MLNKYFVQVIVFCISFFVANFQGVETELNIVM